MTRIMPINFLMVYKIKFHAAIRGHHLYKNAWTPKMGEHLSIKKDTREEAMNYDVHALRVFNDENLVGHIPIEISSILDYFLQQCPDNFIDAEVAGKRKCEVGLVAPADYTACTKDRETARSGRNTSATSNLLSKIMLD